MPLDNRQSFVYGFLCKCAEAGLTTDEIDDAILRLTKEADLIAPLRDFLFPFAKTITNIGVSGLGAIGHAGMLGLGGAAALGAGAGVTAAHLGSSSRPDPKEIQRQELIAAYNSFGDEAEQNNAARQRRDAKPVSLGRRL